MSRDEVYTELGTLGYSGALEDRLFAYLPGDGTLEDKIYADDPTAGGVDNWLGKQSVLSNVTFGGEGATFGGENTTWSS
mgnify:CR=1 FL=1